MAITKNQYTGDGATVNYTFTFEYINETDVKVEIDGVSTTAYSFANATTLTFNSAPANGAAILIYRDTDIDSLDATFFPGSAIKAEDLNSNFTQNNFAVQEIQANTWDNERDTVHSDETWISSNDQIATTAAIDARFQDELSETIESTETWISDDDHIATTEAIDNRVSDTIDTAITNDIGTDGTGITVTDDGDGTITLGLADNAIDFSKIKDADIITYAEQNAGSPSWDSDSRLATTYASSRRFDTLVQATTPSGSDWQVGKTWLQNDQDLTLSIWNGTNWLAIASGGAFINQPKVVYVDASSGNDSNDGHRISRPKATIKAAVNQINADSTYGDGSVVVVAPGVYQEVAPIDITKKDVGIIGTALRSCVVHPTPATEENSLFRVNSGSFLQNLTFTGIKASGSRGGNSLDTDATYGLPTNQGWNVSFYPGATIVKSPYIQNCTNFSDSEITNSGLDPHNPAGGAAGDTDSAPTGGGLLVDGSVVDSNSPLRSMVCDSYTHVGLDGPGIFVTNNGYAQCTSSYAFFNHYHIKCLNGGQANLAASTTDFGRYGLIADGKSPTAIFTATTTVNAADEAILFTIGAPSAGSGWHGSATRPQSNMLVEIGGNIYPILSASANGAGWDVTISRPDPTDRANNLGLDGAVSSGSAVSFYLRSMIASSGHTMEYVGSGTNYSALPENGGVPIEANQIVELNNGKVWTATTDHNGKFKVGDFFTVDQQNSSISVASGSFQVNLGTLAVDGSGNAVIGAPLDLDGNSISDSTGSVTIDDTLDVNGNRIVNVTDPTLAQDAATKNYVDSTFVELQGDTMTGDLVMGGANIVFEGSTSDDFETTFTVTDPTADRTITLPDVTGTVVTTGDTGTVTSTMIASGTIVNADINASAEIAVSKLADGAARQLLQTDAAGTGVEWTDNLDVPGTLDVTGTTTLDSTLDVTGLISADGKVSFPLGTAAAPSLYPGSDTDTGIYSPGANQVAISTNGTGRLFVDANGNVGVGTESPVGRIDVNGDMVFGDANAGIRSNDETLKLKHWGSVGIDIDADNNDADTRFFRITKNGEASELLRVTEAGDVGLGTSAPGSNAKLEAKSTTGAINSATIRANGGLTTTGATDTGATLLLAGHDGSVERDFGSVFAGKENGTSGDHDSYLAFGTRSTGGPVSEKVRISSTGAVGIGTTSVNFPSGNGVEIYDSSTPRLKLSNSTTGTASTDGGYLYMSGSDFLIENKEAGNLRFYTDATEAARIDSSGRLGLGTSSPVDLLTVAGDPASLTLLSTQGTLEAGTRIGKISFYTSDSSGNGTGEYAIIDACTTTRYDNASTKNGETAIRFFTTDNNGSPVTAERVRIDNAGRVGIGTTSPGATLDVNGSLSKSSGSFKIDHPLPEKNETHYLVHSFVEAPDASNLYAGMVDLVDGVAVVNIDTAHRMSEGTFEALNTIQSWSSSNESGYAPVKCSIVGNLLTIECQDPNSNDTVYYEVRGIRKDVHMLSTEWTDEEGRVITEPLKEQPVETA